MSEEPESWRKGQWEYHEIQKGQMQSPAPLNEEVLAEKQPYWQRPWSCDEQQAHSISQQHTLSVRKAISFLVCLKRTIASRSKQVIIDFHLLLIRLHLAQCIQFSVPGTRRCQTGTTSEIGQLKWLEARITALWVEAERKGLTELG